MLSKLTIMLPHNSNVHFLYLLLNTHLLLPNNMIKVTVNYFVPVHRQRSDQWDYRTDMFQDIRSVTCILRCWTMPSNTSLIPRPSHCPILIACKNGGRRRGPFYHMNDFVGGRGPWWKDVGLCCQTLPSPTKEGYTHIYSARKFWRQCAT